MPIERLRPSFPFDEERVKELKKIAPEAFADGKINWETLKEALGEHLEEENSEIEHFGLFWPGKREARKIASIPSQGTLIPFSGEGLNTDGSPDNDGTNNSHNIFIEGENLEVLKILQKSYVGRIKMIYIDPPYNTGNDFVYDDNFTEPLLEYLRRTGQLDEEGKPISTNKKSDGRFHSKWLSMMYPRLKLARILLKEDGVIFISIDENEVHNLRAILNEVFGEENFIATLVWKSRQNKDNRNVTGVSIDHEYIICFSKTNKENSIRGEERKLEQYTNPDNDPRGPWVSGNMVGILPQNLRPNCHYDLIHPNTKINYGKPKLGWRYDKNTMGRLILENRILWPQSAEGRPRRKVFLTELKNDYTGLSSIFGEKIFTRDGTKEIDDLFGYKAFDFPKPSGILKELIIQGTDEDDIILDFFAGSASLAQAILELNESLNIRRSFICVQFPEELDKNSEAYKNGLKNIAEIGKERIRRVCKNLKSQTGPHIDLGFKCFRLENSNFKQIGSYQGKNPEALTIHFDESVQTLVENWTILGLITEIMLIEGFSLDSNCVQSSKFINNKVFNITNENTDQSLIACLDLKVPYDVTDSLSLKENEIFVCFDSAITDQDKLRLSDKGLIKTI